jgi:hypothetical protein
MPIRGENCGAQLSMKGIFPMPVEVRTKFQEGC